MIALAGNYRIKLATFTVARESMPEWKNRARLSSPGEVVAVLRTLIPDDSKEHFVVLMLDAQNGLVAAHHVGTGTLSASLVHPREVFGPALRLMGVASLVLGHNHPSGEVTPSREDLRLTRQLVEAGKLLDIRVHDHVIIGNGSERFTSLAGMGAI